MMMMMICLTAYYFLMSYLIVKFCSYVCFGSFLVHLFNGISNPHCYQILKFDLFVWFNLVNLFNGISTTFGLFKGKIWFISLFYFFCLTAYQKSSRVISQSATEKETKRQERKINVCLFYSNREDIFFLRHLLSTFYLLLFFKGPAVKGLLLVFIMCLLCNNNHLKVPTYLYWF